MNVHLIRENENQNDGSYIHLYRNKQIGAWCAYCLLYTSDAADD
mgnify:CR=1 FL=1